MWGARRRWEKLGEDEQLTEMERVRGLSSSMGVGDEVHEVAYGQRNLPKTGPDTAFVPTTCAAAAEGKRKTHPCSLPGHADTQVCPLGCEPLPPGTPKLSQESSARGFPLWRNGRNKKYPHLRGPGGAVYWQPCPAATQKLCQHQWKEPQHWHHGQLLPRLHPGAGPGWMGPWDAMCEAEGWAPCM